MQCSQMKKSYLWLIYENLCLSWKLIKITINVALGTLVTKLLLCLSNIDNFIVVYYTKQEDMFKKAVSMETTLMLATFLFNFDQG